MPPAQFVSVAEEAGLIDLLGGWILRERSARRPSGARTTSPAASCGCR